MTKEIQQQDSLTNPDSGAITYEDARKRLKEVEILLNHHEPVRINCEELSEELTEAVGVASGSATVGLGVAGAILWSPFMLLLPVLPMAWVFARYYDGRPSSKISRFFSKVFLTKKQQAIQSNYNQSNEEYKLQRKVFILLAQAKKKELIDDGVFKVLHDGVQETYPWIDKQGRVQELTPQAWHGMKENLRIENTTRMEDSLKELISKNPEVVKAITT